MYILECADGSYYTGSTIDLKRRLRQHQNFEGSFFTAKKWPVKLVYFEYYHSIALAFNREKQIQGWRRAKKLALIEGRFKDLPVLSNADLDFRWFRRAQPVAIEMLPEPVEGSI